ncbi:MAG: hypothetical protein ACPL4C_05665 [Brevinematia bacterium]
MKRIAYILLCLVVITSFAFASESRLVGLSWFNLSEIEGTVKLFEDPFNFVYLPGYVNYDSNFVILEPQQGAGIFGNTYGVLKYSLNTPFDRINFGIVVNFPYNELSYIQLISSGIPAIQIPAGVTPLQTFTILDHLRNKVDLVVGVGKILGLSFLKPYAGVGYASDYSLSISKQDDSGTNVSATTNQESISQLKFSLGSIVDLSVISLDAGIKLYLPSALNSTVVINKTTNNYLNTREHKTEGSFGFDITVLPKIKFGNSYLLSLAEYFNYSLPSAQVRKLDANGDGTLEEDSRIDNNYQVTRLNVGASYNTYINQFFISFGGSLVNNNSYRTYKVISNITTPNVTNEGYIQNSSISVPVFVSLEVPFADWFVFRGGITRVIYQASYSLNRIGPEGNGTVTISDLSSPTTSFTTGFSIKPIKDLSVDWVVSFTFMNNVFVNGRLPWIISGNNLFDNVTQKFSIEYRM